MGVGFAIGCGQNVRPDQPDAGVRVSPMSGPTGEDGSEAAFTVVLRTRPKQDVNLLFSSTNTGEGTLTSGGQITFTKADWDQPRTVRVRGVDDDVADGTATFAIHFEPTQSADEAYHGVTVPDLPVSNLDDEIAQVVTSLPTGPVSEDGLTATFTVVLTSKPTSIVRVPVTTTDSTEGTASVTQLEFPPESWDVPQTVTIHGVQDDVPDGDGPFDVQLGPADSIDAAYDGQDVGALHFVNIDDDLPGISVSQASGFVSESGTTSSFSVRLATMPAADVVLSFAVDDATEGSLGAAQLTFTSANWNVVQTVAVSGVDDTESDGLRPFKVMFQPAASNDPDYAGRTPDPLPFNNADDEHAGITVSPVNGLVTESGSPATFSVVLKAQPANDVVLAVGVTDKSEAMVDGTALTFTAANWNVPQQVTVTGVNDLFRDGHQPFRVTFTPTAGSDASYVSVGQVSGFLTNVDDGRVANLLILDDANGSFADEAAADLQLTSTTVTNGTAFDAAFDGGGFDAIVWEESTAVLSTASEARLTGWIAGGGRTIVGEWDLDGHPGLASTLGVSATSYTVYRPIHFLTTLRGAFNNRRQVFPTPLAGVNLTADNGNQLMLLSTASDIVAARLDNASTGPAGIAITNANRSIVNGPNLDDCVGTNADADGVPDVRELYTNEILFLLDLPPRVKTIRTINTTPVTISASGTSTQTSSVTVAGETWPNKKITVTFNIAHTFDSDLDIFLISPTGTRVELTTDNGSSGDNYGTQPSPNACALDTGNSVLDPDSATPVTGGTAPFIAAVYRPEGNLGVLQGTDPNGTWKLEVSDDAGGDGGALNCWALTQALEEP